MSDRQRHEFSERLIDLSVDYAMGLHESSDMNELEELDRDRSARDAFEAVAAELDIAFAETDPADMPMGLEDRLMAAIPGGSGAQSPEPELRLSGGPAEPKAATRPQSAESKAWFPWLVAAASLAFALMMLLQPKAQSPSALEQRDALIAKHADDEDLLRYEWTSTGHAAVVGEVTGELIWDEATDEGFMTIGGLAVNDPSQSQYQLWIFDTARRQGDLPQFEGPFGGLLTQRPIDGGVFDITETGEVVIPIDAKILVQSGIAFAVTIEPPGGVVVSDRTDVPLLAIPPQG
jgi:hypothetical protein